MSSRVRDGRRPGPGQLQQLQYQIQQAVGWQSQQGFENKENNQEWLTLGTVCMLAERVNLEKTAQGGEHAGSVVVSGLERRGKHRQDMKTNSCRRIANRSLTSPVS